MSRINDEITLINETPEDKVPEVDYLKEDFILKTQKVLTYKEQKDMGLLDSNSNITCSICLHDIKEYKASQNPKHAGNVCQL